MEALRGLHTTLRPTHTELLENYNCFTASYGEGYNWYAEVWIMNIS